jgi:hypothetical protein
VRPDEPDDENVVSGTGEAYDARAGNPDRKIRPNNPDKGVQPQGSDDESDSPVSIHRKTPKGLLD